MSRRRRSIPRKKSKRMFSRTARKVNKRNFPSGVARGGIRL